MIWIALGAVTVLAMLPLGFAIAREPRGPARRDAALALLRGQLLEVEQDLASPAGGDNGRADALVDIQRRALAAIDEHEANLRNGAKAPLLLAFAAVPLVA